MVEGEGFEPKIMRRPIPGGEGGEAILLGHGISLSGGWPEIACFHIFDRFWRNSKNRSPGRGVQEGRVFWFPESR